MHIPKKQLVLNTKLSLSKQSGGGGGGGEGKSRSNGNTSALTPLSASEEREMIRNPKVCFYIIAIPHTHTSLRDTALYICFYLNFSAKLCSFFLIIIFFLFYSQDPGPLVTLRD